jgi:methylglutaconyl-CoA hydratase
LLKETKKLLNEIKNADWTKQKHLTTKVISERRMSSEGQERLKKFLEKA